MTKTATSLKKRRNIKKTPVKTINKKDVEKTPRNKPIQLKKKVLKKPIKTVKPTITTKTVIPTPGETQLFWIGPYGCLVNSTTKDPIVAGDGMGTLAQDGIYHEMLPTPIIKMTKKKYLLKYTKKGANGLRFYNKK
jgi:hypothetical protein